MTQADRDRQSVAQMVAAGELVLKFAKVGKHRFDEDLMVRSAIERQFEVTGEASRRVSDAFRQAHPEIPWRSILSFRDVLHGPGDVDPGLVWRTIGGSLRHALEALRSLDR